MYMRQSVFCTELIDFLCMFWQLRKFKNFNKPAKWWSIGSEVKKNESVLFQLSKYESSRKKFTE